MVTSLSYSVNIFESLGYFSNFNLGKTIWKRYERFVTTRLKDMTIKLKGSMFYLKDLSESQAKSELKAIEALMPAIYELKEKYEKIDDKELKEFKVVAIDFFETIDLLYEQLEDIASHDSSFMLSLQTFSNDWDREEDDHWDNYLTK